MNYLYLYLYLYLYPLSMNISLVAAVAANGTIGLENRIPWHLPADLRFFRRITLHKPVLMGRKTHESIGRPLPLRQNIILTHNHTYTAEGCLIVHDLESVWAAVADAPELMVIGGTEIYRLCLPLATHLYLTHIEADIAGDAFFPSIEPTAWQPLWRETHEPDEQHAYRFHITAYERRAG